MSGESKNLFAGIGAVLGLVAGISLGVWLASGWPGGVGQNITALCFLSILGLSVGGGLGWLIGTTIQNPVVGMRLLYLASLIVLFLVLRLLFNLPRVAVAAIVGSAAAILFWWSFLRGKTK
jgi:hypothetical protein